jgi:hypothetical protein
MSRFPRTEAEITALALLMVDGLTQAPDDFPAPPVQPSELQAKLDAYNAAYTIQRRRQSVPVRAPLDGPTLGYGDHRHS